MSPITNLVFVAKGIALDQKQMNEQTLIIDYDPTRSVRDFVTTTNTQIRTARLETASMRHIAWAFPGYTEKPVKGGLRLFSDAKFDFVTGRGITRFAAVVKFMGSFLKSGHTRLDLLGKGLRLPASKFLQIRRQVETKTNGVVVCAGNNVDGSSTGFDMMARYFKETRSLVFVSDIRDKDRYLNPMTRCIVYDPNDHLFLEDRKILPQTMSTVVWAPGDDVKAGLLTWLSDIEMKSRTRKRRRHNEEHATVVAFINSMKVYLQSGQTQIDLVGSGLEKNQHFTRLQTEVKDSTNVLLVGYPHIQSWVLKAGL